jgi:ribosomal protein S18 acetylase RimI-like enzyme
MNSPHIRSAYNLAASKVRIVPMERQHVAGAVELHLLAFRGFFLAFLGKGFLRQLYRAAAGHKETVGYVALDDRDNVVGACFGFINARRYYRELLKKRWWAFALHSIWPVLRRPAIIPRLLRARKHEGDPPPLSVRPLGSLLSIAVRPSSQGTGVATALMRATCQEYVRRGIHAVYLNTDANNNDMVRGFYKAKGWKFIGYYTKPESRRMCWYVWLDPAVEWAPDAIPSTKE